MAVCTGRKKGIGFAPSRAGRYLGVAAALAVLASPSQQSANAIGDTRTIILHHVHTNEDLTITYKRDGRYDDAAIKRISQFLRDWRRNEHISMDPHLIDLLWEVHQEVGSKGAIHIICGYRAPETNAMLRARSSGVAMYSQHMAGTATDFFIPGVPIDELRAAALRLQGGGVGFYPGSGSRFVHVDTGNVRHWPRMSRDELVKVFPNQRTIHVPSDGQPLAGYALALADYERGVKSSPRPTKLALMAKASGVHDDEEMSTGSTKRPPMPMARPANLTVAAVSRPEPQTPAKPAELTMMAPASGTVAPKAKIATARSVSPASIFLPWPSVPQNDRVSPEVAMAYAAVNEPVPPMELGNVQRVGITPQAAVPQPVQTAPEKFAAISEAGSRVALGNVQRSSVMPQVPAMRPAPATPDKIAAIPTVTSNPRANSPWLRAVVLAPTMYQFMAMNQLNPLDSRQLVTFMQKPRSALSMGFSADPYNGMTTTAFSGKAVQFLATVHFGMRTAGLR